MLNATYVLQALCDSPSGCAYATVLGSDVQVLPLCPALFYRSSDVRLCSVDCRISVSDPDIKKEAFGSVHIGRYLGARNLI